MLSIPVHEHDSLIYAVFDFFLWHFAIFSIGYRKHLVHTLLLCNLFNLGFSLENLSSGYKWPCVLILISAYSLLLLICVCSSSILQTC